MAARADTPRPGVASVRLEIREEDHSLTLEGSVQIAPLSIAGVNRYRCGPVCPISGLSAGQFRDSTGMYLSKKDTCSEAVDRPYLRTQSAVKPPFCGSCSVIACFFRMAPRALPLILVTALILR
jgi:hypothetical protein